MSEGVFLVEPETFQIIDCNQEFVNIIGYESIEQARELNLMDFVTADRREIEKLAARMMADAQSVNGERAYRRRDGSLVEVEVTGRCISYNSGNVFCINIKDITDRKLTELEIRRLALVAEKTENGVLIMNTLGEIQWSNEGFERISGYKLDEVIGRRPDDFLHGEKTKPETIAAMMDAVIHQKPFSGEIYNYGKDGSGYWVSLLLTPFHDPNGRLEGIIAMAIDISKRIEMEEIILQAHEDLEFRVARRTSELIELNKKMADEVCERTKIENQLGKIRQFLLKVIDSVPNLIFVKDYEGKFTLANRSLAQFYGVEAKELIGKTDADFAPNKDDAEKFQKDDREVIESWEEKIIFEEKLTDVGGNVHWLHTVKRPLFDSSGVRSILGISTDLTERKILEGQLRHAQKLESIGQLAAGIAHEINTPTQYVSDNTRFIRDAFIDINAVLKKYDELIEAARTGQVDSDLIEEIEQEIEQADLEYLIGEVPKAINQSLEGVSRIANIVQSMKDFAHPESGDKKMADINKAIESTITVTRNEWKYVAEMETNFDNSLPPVPCLLGEFNQVIMRKRGEANRRAHIIGKRLESSAVRNHAAVERHAVHRRAHRVFAHAEMNVAPRVFAELKIGRILDHRIVRRRQISRAADHLRDFSGNRVDHFAGESARRFRFPVVELRQVFFPAVGQLARARVFQSLPELGKFLFVFFNERVPLFFQLCAGFDGFAKMRRNFLRHVKMLVFVPAEISFRFFYRIFAGRVRMGFRGSLFRHSEADDRLYADELRFVLDFLRVLDRLFDRFEIIAVFDDRHVPAARFKAFRDVFGKRQIGRAVDRNAVVVVEIN